MAGMKSQLSYIFLFSHEAKVLHTLVNTVFSWPHFMLYLLPFACLLGYFGLTHHIKMQGGGERFRVVRIENNIIRVQK